MVPVLGVLDYISGYEISFAIFYLLPVVFIGWLHERNYAIMVSILSACDLDDLIKEADNLMDTVKDSGKNRIEYKTLTSPNTEVVYS